MKKRLFAAFLMLIILLTGCKAAPEHAVSVDNVPPYKELPYVIINDNIPAFTQQDYTTSSYEYYSELDEYGRCGYAMVCVGVELMPTEERESISQIKPSGWVNNEYDFVDGGYVYNRCHLIGFQLTGENANEQNLITGTRYLNTEGMLPFENIVADYVRDSENHVIYRVTPVYDGDHLVARGVQMEAWSVEDDGKGVCFNVYCYNVQPGVEIDYATGENYLPGTKPPTEAMYIINISSCKFHSKNCGQINNISDENKEEYYGSRSELIDKGYSPAGCCKP